MNWTHPHVWRVFFGRIRRLRRLLGWSEAARLAISELTGRRLAHPYLAAVGRRIELRLDHSDAHVFEKIWLELEYLPPFAVQPEFIIDAGANVGLSALYFATLFPAATIVALEPEKTNFQQLTRNTASHPKIQPQLAALWGSSAALQIADESAASWAFRITESAAGAGGGHGDTIPAVTIPQLLAQHDRDRVDVLKLDIEGAERELFTPACREWLPKVGMIIIELHDRDQPGCSHAFYSELVRLGDFAQEQRGENLFIKLPAPSQVTR